MLIAFFFYSRFLVSGSDDFNIIIWKHSTQSMQTSLPTGHDGNIFAVKVVRIRKSV